jgi:hypothetical protein
MENTDNQNQDTAIESVNTQEEGTSTSSDTEGRKFSQEEVDNIVQGRLAKSSNKYTDYDELKKYKEESEAAKLTETERLTKQLSELTNIKAVNDTRGTLLETVLEDALKGVPEDKLSLIPTDFSVEDKLKFFIANKSHFVDSNPIANIDDSKPRESNKSGAYGGKYSSLEEWAREDPAAYLAARKSNKLF